MPQLSQSEVRVSLFWSMALYVLCAAKR